MSLELYELFAHSGGQGCRLWLCAYASSRKLGEEEQVNFCGEEKDVKGGGNERQPVLLALPLS